MQPFTDDIDVSLYAKHSRTTINNRQTNINLSLTTPGFTKNYDNRKTFILCFIPMLKTPVVVLISQCCPSYPSLQPLHVPVV